MPILRKFVAVIAVSVLNLGSLGTQSANAAEYAIKRIDSSTLSFRGKIVEGSAQELMSQLTTETRLLQITSQGGSQVEAILMGKLLSEQNMTLVVDQYCIAACANYVFLGAKNKFLQPASLLGFQNTNPLQGLAELKRRFENKEVNSQSFNVNISKTNSAEFLQILEWEYLQTLQLDTNTLAMIHNKMLEGIETNKDIAKQMRVSNSPMTTGFYEDVAEPNPIDRRLQIAKSRKSYSMKTDKNGTGSVYFPPRDFLLALGIKGIGSYPYPTNEDALNALFHRDLENITTIAYSNGHPSSVGSQP